MGGVHDRRGRGWLLNLLAVFVVWGCVPLEPRPDLKDSGHGFPAGTIVHSRTGQPLSFQELMIDLGDVGIVYVGERHNDPAHHEVQLKIIRALAQGHPSVGVGMEMFARTYQPVLDQWSAGELDRQTFLQRTHWYANWRFDFDLYAEILDFIREHHLPLIGLNVPFHIPPKIATGGLASLQAADSAQLPRVIDTTRADHREYLRRVFESHHLKGRDNFEFFYGAQCVWEETMAESIARHRTEGGKLVILAGNGHIQFKYGIPDRAFGRNQLAFRTIYLVSAGGGDLDPNIADYIWVTPAVRPKGP